MLLAGMALGTIDVTSRFCSLFVANYISSTEGARGGRRLDHFGNVKRSAAGDTG